MKRLIIVLIGLWAVGTAFAQTVNESAHLSDAINTVKTFYDAFGEIAKDPETDSAMEAQRVCFELMFEPELLSFPNDFHGLDSLLMGLLFVTSFRRYLPFQTKGFLPVFVPSAISWRILHAVVLIFWRLSKCFAGP